MSRTNKGVIALQGMCLTLIVVIQYIIRQIGERGSSTMNEISNTDKYDTFMFMTIMISLIIVVLEIAKNQNLKAI